MNNEPLTKESNTSLSKGFASNKDREPAYWFGKEAVEAFLTANNLTHLIRSNNIYDKKGYFHHFELKCLTLFSNSNPKYNNDLVTAFIDNEKIRLLLIAIEDQSKDNTNETVEIKTTRETAKDKDTTETTKTGNKQKT